MSLRIAIVSLLLSSLGLAEPLKELRLDHATYNPSSLVLKKFGWVEEALSREGTKVTWLFSAGSNKANELLSSGSADLASTAGAAALLARTNGVPLKVVYVYSKPEWAALVVPKDSPVKSVAELKGKKIAATRGTDPFFFLLRTLQANGLRQIDVELVNLQHADGRTALERGQVDAWAGLDPHLAASELQAGSRLLSRNIDFNTFGTLNAREEFLRAHPEVVRTVLAQYERARAWILAHPGEAVQILAEAAKLSPEVARKQLTERTVLDRDVGVPGEKLRAALAAVVPILRSEKLVAPGADPEKALSELLAPGPAQEARR
ncbi:MAG: aliphatic sulfonate ABC transporter substrate-binding protein [Myxococcaceae bacterium]|nr:MAG: aliphatic sulfonate ABC transporter substrate-binding protein [Myxococcaceae bacterium]